MADELTALPMHPIDREALFSRLEALFSASARGPAPTPPWPPANVSPFETPQLIQFKQSINRDVDAAIRDAVHEFLPADEIDDRIKAISATIDRRLDDFGRSFLASVEKIVEAGNDKLKTELLDMLFDVNLPMRDKDERKQLGKKFDGLFAMYDGSREWRAEAWKAFKASTIGGLGVAITGFLGYLWTRGGTSH